MKQLRHIPSGCLPSQIDLVAASSSHLAYCSSKSIHIFDPEKMTFSQTAIAHDKPITSISFNPSASASFVTTGLDSRVIQWTAGSHQPWVDGNIAKVVTSIGTPDIPVFSEWCPSESNTVAVLQRNGRVVIATLDATSVSSSCESQSPPTPAGNIAGRRRESRDQASLRQLSPSFEKQPSIAWGETLPNWPRLYFLPPTPADVACFRWLAPPADSANQRLLYGLADGSLSIISRTSTPITIAPPTPLQGISVRELKLHPDDDNLVLALYASSQLVLYNLQTASIISVFRPQPGYINSICFIPGTNTFLTAVEGEQNMLLWSLSRDVPLQYPQLTSLRADLAISHVFTHTTTPHAVDLNAVSSPGGNPTGMGTAPVPSFAVAATATASANSVTTPVPSSVTTTVDLTHPSPYFEDPENTTQARVFISQSNGTILSILFPSLHIIASTSASHSGAVFDVQACPFAPSVFASAGWDGSVRIWDTNTMHDDVFITHAQPLSAHTQPSATLAFTGASYDMLECTNPFSSPSSSSSSPSSSSSYSSSVAVAGMSATALFGNTISSSLLNNTNANPISNTNTTSPFSSTSSLSTTLLSPRSPLGYRTGVAGPNAALIGSPSAPSFAAISSKAAAMKGENPSVPVYGPEDRHEISNFPQFDIPESKNSQSPTNSSRTVSPLLLSNGLQAKYSLDWHPSLPLLAVAGCHGDVCVWSVANTMPALADNTNTNTSTSTHYNTTNTNNNTSASATAMANTANAATAVATTTTSSSSSSVPSRPVLLARLPIHTKPCLRVAFVPHNPALTHNGSGSGSGSGSGLGGSVGGGSGGVSNSMNANHSSHPSSTSLSPSTPSLPSCLLASTCGDAYLTLCTLDGVVQQRLHHPMPVYGFSFCPSVQGLLAVACADGNVYLWDLTVPLSLVSQPILALKGHSRRVFSLQWSPNVRGLLASASDDNTVRVWDVLRGICVTVCTGHTKPVRALLWCHELPQILLSAGWDSCIRVWDVRDGKCLAALPYHYQDVYALASHPARPFLIYSSGKDGSFREWCFSQSLLRTLRTRAVLQGRLDPSFSAASQTILTDTPSPHMLFCGQTSKKISASECEPATNSDLTNFSGIATLHSLFLGAQYSQPLFHLAAKQDHPSLAPGTFPNTNTGPNTTITATTSATTTTTTGAGAGVGVGRGVGDGSLSSGTTTITVTAPTSTPSTLTPTTSSHRPPSAPQHTLLSPLLAHPSLSTAVHTHINDIRASLWMQARALLHEVAPQTPNTTHAVEEAPPSTTPTPSTSKSMRNKQMKAQVVVPVAEPVTVLPPFPAPIPTAVTDTVAREKLGKAADIFLQLGCIYEYCQAHIRLGNWEKALALAPAATPAYWRQVMLQYSQYLQQIRAPASVPYLLASGDVSATSDALHGVLGHSRGSSDALSLAVGDSNGVLPLYLRDVASMKADQQELHEYLQQEAERERVDMDRGEVAATERVTAVMTSKANALAVRGDSIGAACAYLSINNINAAVKALVEGDELDLAISLCLVLQIPDCDYVWRLAAQKCENLELWDEALECLQQLSNTNAASGTINGVSSDILLLCARFRGSTARKHDMYAKAGLRSPTIYAQEGMAMAMALKEAATAPITGKGSSKTRTRGPAVTTDGSDLWPQRELTLYNLIAGGRHIEALTTGVLWLQDTLGKPTWTTMETDKYITPLLSAHLETVPTALRYMFLAYVMYFAALRAVVLGYSSIAPYLFDCVTKSLYNANNASGHLISSSNTGGNGIVTIVINDIESISMEFPISTYIRQWQLAQGIAARDPVASYCICSEILSDSGIPSGNKIKTAAAALKKALENTSVVAHHISHGGSNREEDGMFNSGMGTGPGMGIRNLSGSASSNSRLSRGHVSTTTTTTSTMPTLETPTWSAFTVTNETGAITVNTTTVTPNNTGTGTTTVTATGMGTGVGVTAKPVLTFAPQGQNTPPPHTLPFFTPAFAPVIGAVMSDLGNPDAVNSLSHGVNAFFGKSTGVDGSVGKDDGNCYSLTNYGANTCMGYGAGIGSPIWQYSSSATTIQPLVPYEAGTSRPSSSTTATLMYANTVALNASSAAAVNAIGASGGRSGLVSIITGKPVGNSPVTLEDGVSVLSRTEALMLQQVLPFSPTLSGQRFKLV